MQWKLIINKRRLFWLLTGIICGGCALQLLFLFFVIEPNTLEWHDSKHYLSIANALANGESYSIKIRNLYRSPGYPYFLSILIRIFGNKLLLIRLVHIALFALFLLGAYFLGKEWKKNEKFGLFLSLACCFYPYYLYIPLSIVPESLLVIISTWIIYFLIRLHRSINIYILLFASLTISIAALTRPTYIIVSVVFVCFYILSKFSVLKKLKVFICIFLIPILALASWGYRNYRVHDYFIIATAGSINMYKGFNENTTISTKSDVPTTRSTKEKLSKANNSFEKNNIYKNEALDFIKRNPVKSIYLTFVRMLDLWNPIPHTSTEYSWIKKTIASIPYIIILLLSLIGIYTLRNEKITYLLVGILILNTVVNGFFAVSVRYRVIFDVILLMFFVDYVCSKCFNINTSWTNIDN